VVLNSLNLCLSEKLFISPPIWNEILDRYSNHGCRFFPFSTLNISCHSLLACRVSAERSAVKHMGFPLYVTCCFSPAAFNILSLCIVFVSLISMCLGMFLLGFILYGTLYASWTWLTISFSMLGRLSTIISSKIFSYPFFFSSSSGTPIMQMFLHLTLSQRSWDYPQFFSFFYFILLFRSYFYHFIFQLTDDSSASDILLLIPSGVVLISVIVLLVSVCLFFNYSRSLLIDSCIFSILLSRFLIMFTIIFLNSFSGSLPISSSFIWTSMFLVCSFICVVFLCLFIIIFFNLCIWGLLFPGFNVEFFLPFGFCPSKFDPVVYVSFI